MALADLNAYLATMAGPHQPTPFMKFLQPGNGSGGGTSSHWWSGWTAAPNAGSAPGAAATCDRTTAGAIGQYNAATELRMVLQEIQSLPASAVTAQHVLMIADRLCHMGGLDGTNITAQTVSTPAVPRYTPSTDRLCAAVETYTAVGATATTLTVSYTNQAGTAGQTSQPIPYGGTSMYQQPALFQPISLAAGDVGVSSVQSLTLAGTTGTVGSFGVTIYKPLLIVPIVSSMEELNRFDPITRLGGLMPLVQPSACLFWAVMTAPVNAFAIPMAGRLSFFED